MPSNRVISVLEGGYNLEGLASASVSHLQAFLQEKSITLIFEKNYPLLDNFKILGYVKIIQKFSRLESSAPSSNLLIIPTKEGISRLKIEIIL